MATTLPKATHLCIPALKDFTNSCELNAEDDEMKDLLVLPSGVGANM
jgi:hypothetical protein